MDAEQNERDTHLTFDLANWRYKKTKTNGIDINKAQSFMERFRYSSSNFRKSVEKNSELARMNIVFYGDTLNIYRNG